jgi:hypothetical protein
VLVIFTDFAAGCAVFGSTELRVDFFVFKMRGKIGFFREEYAEVETGEVGQWCEGLCECDLYMVKWNSFCRQLLVGVHV